MINVRPHPHIYPMWGIWSPKFQYWLQHTGYESSDGPAAFRLLDDACRAAREELADGGFSILVLGRLHDTHAENITVLELLPDGRVAARTIGATESGIIETEAEKAQPFKLEAGK